MNIDGLSNTDAAAGSQNTAQIKIDTEEPSISGSRAPAANGYGWNNVDVTASFTASDSTSGLASVTSGGQTLTENSGSYQVIVSTEGTDQSVTATATDVAGNTNSATVANINIDKTAPTVTYDSLPSPIILNQPLSLTWHASDDRSGIPAGSESGTITLDTSSVGSHTYTITAGIVSDKAGNPSGAVTVTYSVIYNFGGFLPPINTQGHMSAFKKGSTIPVKFQLTDYDGNSISTATATISLKWISGTIPTDIEPEAISTSAATTGNLFRYDSTGNQYIFNLATKTLSAPSVYQITATLDDGQSYSVSIGLR